VFTEPERLTLAGFLAGYTGLTREAYTLGLRQYASWCQQHHIRLFQARRADIECFARDLEARGRARATITRRSLPSWDTVRRLRARIWWLDGPLPGAGRMITVFEAGDSAHARWGEAAATAAARWLPRPPPSPPGPAPPA
jgi:hypothetical protein